MLLVTLREDGERWVQHGKVRAVGTKKAIEFLSLTKWK